jgi:hypothetical protein
MQQRDVPKVRAVLSKDGKPINGKRGIKIKKDVWKRGKVVYESYGVKALNTIVFMKSHHCNLFALKRL